MHGPAACRFCAAHAILRLRLFLCQCPFIFKMNGVASNSAPAWVCPPSISKMPRRFSDNSAFNCLAMLCRLSAVPCRYASFESISSNAGGRWPTLIGSLTAGIWRKVAARAVAKAPFVPFATAVVATIPVSVAPGAAGVAVAAGPRSQSLSAMAAGSASRAGRVTPTNIYIGGPVSPRL